LRLAVERPGPLRALHIGGYWRGSNDMVRHMMLGLRAVGVEVLEYCTDEHMDALDFEGRPYDRGTYGPVWLRWEHLRDPIERFLPHLVVCNAGGLAFRPDDARRLRQRATLLGIALSEPDVFDTCTRYISPERSLVLAIVWQTLIDLQKYRFATRRRQQRLYMEAYRWVASDDRQWPYSFCNVAEMLDVAPERLRDQLLGDVAPVLRVSEDAPADVEEAA